MSDLKGWVSRLYTAVVIALLVCQGVFVINPINKESSVTDGYCHITMLRWTKVPCLRSGSLLTYNIPSLSGNFWIHMNPVMKTFAQLSVDIDHVNEKSKGMDFQAFLIDDLSDSTLLDCSNTSITSTKQLLVDYLPVFKEVLNVTSKTEHLPKLYPDRFIDCSYRNTTHVYLRYKRLNKLLVIPFVFNIFLIGVGLHLIIENDDDGPIKEFSTMISMPFYLAAFVLHAIGYVLFVAVIGWTIFNIEPTLSLEESFNKGSIFLIFKWLKKKIGRCCRPSNSTSS